MWVEKVYVLYYKNKKFQTFICTNRKQFARVKIDNNKEDKFNFNVNQFEKYKR
jgi:hypothetical protein